MNRSNYIYCKDGEIIIKDMSPYIGLLFAISGENLLKLTINSLQNIKVLTDDIMEMLTEREEKVLRNRFGLVNGQECTFADIGDSLGLEAEEVKKVYDKAIRKLRHPSRFKRLMGNIPDYDSEYYATELKNILIYELTCMLEGKLTKSLFLKSIQKRYGIIIERERDNESELMSFSKNIKELGFSVRTYNCLRRAGISTILELQELTVEDMMKIRNLGPKNIEEINNKLRETKEETFHFITVKCENTTTVYKYSDEDLVKVAMSLYKLIFELDSSKTSIFQAHFSPGLQGILLLKGYIYADDVYADSDLLEKQLKQFEFENYAVEVNYLKFHEGDIFYEDGYAVIMLSDSEIIDFIQDNDIKTINELRKIAEKIENDKIIDFINNIF